MPQNQTFEPLDAMDIRTKLGKILDRVTLTNQRFQVMRRGKIKALLVPVSDKPVIEKQTTTDKLKEAYNALMSLSGIIDDPAMKDAGSSIDEWLYGDKGDKAPQPEGNGE